MEVNAKVGDTVYIRLDGNAARCIRTDEELIQEWKVTRIGRKYIYAKRQGDVRDTCFEFFEGDGSGLSPLFFQAGNRGRNSKRVSWLKDSNLRQI